MPFDRITHDPAVMGGMVFGLLAAGYSRERVRTAYPYLEAEDIDAVLSYA